MKPKTHPDPLHDKPKYTSMWQMSVTATQDANIVFNDAMSEYLNIEDEAAVHRHIVTNKTGMIFYGLQIEKEEETISIG